MGKFQKGCKTTRENFQEANKAKLRYHQYKPKFKYGVQIPRNYAEAICLDQKNKNTLWQDAIKLELELMGSYNVFKDLGKHAPVPEGFKNIRVHLVFDCKHDGCHR